MINLEILKVTILDQVRYLIFNWGQTLVMINFWASVFWNRKPSLIFALARIAFFGCWGTERKKTYEKQPFPISCYLETLDLQSCLQFGN